MPPEWRDESNAVSAANRTAATSKTELSVKTTKSLRQRSQRRSGESTAALALSAAAQERGRDLIPLSSKPRRRTRAQNFCPFSAAGLVRKAVTCVPAHYHCRRATRYIPQDQWPFSAQWRWKTSLLMTLPPKETLCIDLEAGMKSVQDWPGDSIPVRIADALDVGCLVGGVNPAALHELLLGGHYQHLCKTYPIW
jgi:hypothetical protein